jgi:hypothetical protein
MPASRAKRQEAGEYRARGIDPEAKRASLETAAMKMACG